MLLLHLIGDWRINILPSPSFCNRKPSSSAFITEHADTLKEMECQRIAPIKMKLLTHV